MAYKHPDFYNHAPKSTSGAKSIPQAYGVELAIVIALLVALILGGISVRPGWHLVGATVLLNLIVWRRARPFTVPRLTIMLLLDVLALVFVIVGQSTMQLWLSGFYGISAILLALFL